MQTTLATIILDIARTLTPALTNIDGTSKVWLCDVREALGTKAPVLAAPAHWDRIVCEMRQAGLLDLSRCDLPGSMDLAKVKASELADINAAYHFLVV